jgi:hypothetical protein
VSLSNLGWSAAYGGKSLTVRDLSVTRSITVVGNDGEDSPAPTKAGNAGLQMSPPLDSTRQSGRQIGLYEFQKRDGVLQVRKSNTMLDLPPVPTSTSIQRGVNGRTCASAPFVSERFLPALLVEDFLPFPGSFSSTSFIDRLM